MFDTGKTANKIQVIELFKHGFYKIKTRPKLRGEEKRKKKKNKDVEPNKKKKQSTVSFYSGGVKENSVFLKKENNKINCSFEPNIAEVTNAEKKVETITNKEVLEKRRDMELRMLSVIEKLKKIPRSDSRFDVEMDIAIKK